jgi:hypothetical protein
MALAVALVVVLPFLFGKWASAPLPDPDAERLKVKGRLARGTVSLLVGALLATNINAIHAHPSQLVVGVGSIATVFALFYGAYALLKGATSVYSASHLQGAHPKVSPGGMVLPLCWPSHSFLHWHARQLP